MENDKWEDIDGLTYIGGKFSGLASAPSFVKHIGLAQGMNLDFDDYFEWFYLTSKEKIN
jgi:hypothetical protein